LEQVLEECPLEKFLEIKGLSDVKIIRIAAAFEMAKRIVKQVLEESGQEKI
jgi:DNA repair protein RadC